MPKHLKQVFLRQTNERGAKKKNRETARLTSSVALASAPAFNKEFIISGLPLSAAMCKGVAPPAVIFTLAPACTGKKYR